MSLSIFLTFISSLFFLAAVYFSYRLSRETEHEHYWIFFVIASIGFGIAHFTGKNLTVFEIDTQTVFLLHEFGEIIGAFSLAYASFGLYNSMKKIREKLS